jgi:hypothetical protein
VPFFLFSFRKTEFIWFSCRVRFKSSPAKRLTCRSVMLAKVSRLIGLRAFFEKTPGALHIHRRERFDLALGRFIRRQGDGRAYL